ncbi:chaplin [Streptomyces sp. ITFR-16]|nr:chaplin [Streptomyces sp. ITFR-16]WNI26820.1 chaplin [Streptomyces sp. ITFR-16]
MLVMAAASGILTASGGYAFADASAEGAAIGSPGVGSGNAVQAPVHVPVNVCGNTVNVIGALNPAFGNECENESGDSGAGQSHGHGNSSSGASAQGVAANSPGVLSGNLIQVPVDVPVNVCGNTVNVVGALNPAAGNKCENDEGGNEPPKPPHHPKPPKPHKPPKHHHDGDCPPEHHKPPHHPKPPKPHKPPKHHHNGDCPPGHHNPPTHPPHHPPTHPPHHPKPPKPHNPPTHNPPTHTWHPHNPPTHTWHHTPTKHHKPPQMAHTGANDNLGIAGGASAALVLGGSLLMRRSRAARQG